MKGPPVHSTITVTMVQCSRDTAQWTEVVCVKLKMRPFWSQTHKSAPPKGPAVSMLMLIKGASEAKLALNCIISLLVLSDHPHQLPALRSVYILNAQSQHTKAVCCLLCWQAATSLPPLSCWIISFLGFFFPPLWRVWLMAGADASWLSRIPERGRATLSDGCLLLCLSALPQQAV